MVRPYSAWVSRSLWARPFQEKFLRLTTPSWLRASWRRNHEIFMQVGGADSLIRTSRRKKHGRRGLEAIFTSQNDGRNTQVLTGAAGIVAGLFLSILAAFRVEDPQALGPWANAVYSSLLFGSLGILLLICGGGTIIFAFRDNRRRQDSSITSRIDEHSEVDLPTDSKDPKRTLRMFGPGSKMGAAAFIQSLALVAMYSGFVQEFESNLSMQTWIRSNFPVGQSVLNWEGVLILSVSLGLLLLQFLPGRFLSE